MYLTIKKTFLSSQLTTVKLDVCGTISLEACMVL